MVAARVGHPVAFTVMIGEDVPVAVPTIDWVLVVACRLPFDPQAIAADPDPKLNAACALPPARAAAASYRRVRQVCSAHLPILLP